MRKAVKIVATIGPKTNSREGVAGLLRAGADIFRLNGSHSDLDWHGAAIQAIRAETMVAPILLDIPGSKIRTGNLGDGIPLSSDQLISFGVFSSTDRSLTPTTLQVMPSDIEPGQRIFADDGTLEFEVLELGSDSISCRTITPGLLRTAKGLNFPASSISDGELSERDTKLLSFAAENLLDFVGISFVHSARQVTRVREVLGADGPSILAKIENQAGFENREEVISAADAVMIDRGDLATETGKFEVGVRQTVIVRDCVRLAKPVVVATEMLHSMTHLPFPTKAEVSDITTAVLQGASATMLSGETAVGDFPEESVAAMAQTISATEEFVLSDQPVPDLDVPDLMLDAAAALALSAKVAKCIVFTRSGYAARRMSSRLSGVEILVVSDDERTARRVNLLRGVRGFASRHTFSRETADFVRLQIDEFVKDGVLRTGDRLLVTGVMFPREGERQNFLLLTEASD